MAGSSVAHGPSSRIPVVASLLGWAGALPFVVLAILAGTQLPLAASWVVAALAGYGAAILAFMGGVQWGLEMAQANPRPGAGYAASVVPALLAAASTLAPALVALGLLAGAFAGLLVYDLHRAWRGIGPAWYPRLRVQLSLVVIASLLLAAFHVARSGS